MLKVIIANSAKVKICSSCTDAKGKKSTAYRRNRDKHYGRIDKLGCG